MPARKISRAGNLTRPHTTQALSGGYKMTNVRDILEEMDRPNTANGAKANGTNTDRELDTFLDSMDKVNLDGYLHGDSTQSVNKTTKNGSTGSINRLKNGESMQSVSRLSVSSASSQKSATIRRRKVKTSIYGSEPSSSRSPRSATLNHCREETLELPVTRPKSAWESFSDHVKAIRTDATEFSQKFFARRNPSATYRQTVTEIQPDTKIFYYHHRDSTSLDDSTEALDKTADLSDRGSVADEKENELALNIAEESDPEMDENERAMAEQASFQKQFERRIGRHKTWPKFVVTADEYTDSDPVKLKEELYKRYLYTRRDKSWLVEKRRLMMSRSASAKSFREPVSILGSETLRNQSAMYRSKFEYRTVGIAENSARPTTGRQRPTTSGGGGTRRSNTSTGNYRTTPRVTLSTF